MIPVCVNLVGEIERMCHDGTNKQALLGTPSQRLVIVVWYHDTMTKSITVRLPDELAADAEALARVDGTSLNETVKKSLLKEVERRRKSPEFKARLTRIIEEDRELLERLAR